MSLINEALKKAQRMRAETPSTAAAPGPDGSPAPVVIRRGRPVPAQVIVLSILGGAVLIGAALVITLLMLRPGTPEASPAVTPKTTAVATPASADTTAAPVVIALPPVGPVLPTTAATPAPEKQVAPPPAATTKAPAPTPSSLAPATAAPAANVKSEISDSKSGDSVAAAAAPVTPSGPAKPDLRVQEFIDRLRVSGIRASPTDPRVSMNDRVFKLNDVVDRTLGLRIIAIEASGLTFVDAAGVVYTKNF